MNIRLLRLRLRTRRTDVDINFADTVTFLHGPISKGKSTVARLVDYCLGGDLERTPAIQQEFVSAELRLVLGEHGCVIERAADDTQSVRVSWSAPNGESFSASAPLKPQDAPLVGDDVFNLSDLVFHLCGVTPIQVRQRARDPESPLIRLSIRDIWGFCYLEQLHLDSSFFRFEDPFRGRKSQDAMRFFTGLHSERFSQLETEMLRTADDQRSKREAVKQIRGFMNRFELGSEVDLMGKLEETERELRDAERRRVSLEATRSVQTHPTDTLRVTLRGLGAELEKSRLAVAESEEAIAEQRALRAEFITAKVKAERVDQAGRVLEGTSYQRCPECGSGISERRVIEGVCRLCGTTNVSEASGAPMEMEAFRRDLNERIDQIADSVARRERELTRMIRQLEGAERQKDAMDRQLQEELARYDSAYVESIRGVEREAATLRERIASLRRLQQMPLAINTLEEEAGALQGRIDRLRSALGEERARLRAADECVSAIASEFKRIMLSVSFPGVFEDDEIVIDPRNWRPNVVHGAQEWSFWDAGSGGKKTLFNVCYALAIHSVAGDRAMPVPSVLIIDSPTKNISDDENPDLVEALYSEIYRLAGRQRVQLLLIDSDLHRPSTSLPDFKSVRMAGEPGAPSLIPYYEGP